MLSCAAALLTPTAAMAGPPTGQPQDRFGTDHDDPQIPDTPVERPQGEPTAPVQWTYSTAEKFVAPVNSNTFRARHALLGITAFATSGWRTWAKCLPATAESAEPSLSPLASSVVLDTLMPAFATGHGPLTPADLADLLIRVSAWAQLEEGQVADAVRSVIEELPWDGDSSWPARVALYAAIDKIIKLESGDGPVGGVVSSDLTTCLCTLIVDEDLVDDFVCIAANLPEALRGHLVDRISEKYQPTESEAAEGLRLRLDLLRLASRSAVPADELLAVEDPSTNLVDAWLALNPPVDEVKKVVGGCQATALAMGVYAEGLGTDEGTGLWVPANTASVSDGLLEALGQHGVTSAAVDHCRQVVAAYTQQVDRKAAVARLCAASPVRGSSQAVAALRRAAADLATRPVGAKRRRSAHRL